MPIEIPIAQHATIQQGNPYRMSTRQSVHDLRLVGDALMWFDAHHNPQSLPLQWMLWASAVHAMDNPSEHRIYLHWIQDNYYHILAIIVAPIEMSVLRRILRGLQSPTQPDLIMPSSPMRAYVANQDMRGTLTAGASVMLYLLPHRLIILNEELVSAQINLTSLRRVIAIENLPRYLLAQLPAWHRFWGWLSGEDTEDGLLRLHSAGETALFITPEYLTIAKHIAQTATCTAEFIARDDKERK